MPSTRSSVIIGLWVIIAIMTMADFFLFNSSLLDHIQPGAGGLANIMVMALFPIIIASLLVDRRVSHQVNSESNRPAPRGARSASGQPLAPARPQPRVRRTKRAAKLETIVMDAEPSIGSTVTLGASSRPLTEPSESTRSSRYLQAQRSPSAESIEKEKKVKEQLEAIEQEISKLEEELKETGIPSTESRSSDSGNDEEMSSDSPSKPEITSTSNERKATPDPSELHAIGELLARLEEKRDAGLVDSTTYERLRSKYMKRKAELSELS